MLSQLVLFVFSVLKLSNPIQQSGLFNFQTSRFQNALPVNFSLDSILALCYSHNHDGKRLQRNVRRAEIHLTAGNRKIEGDER